MNPLLTPRQINMFFGLLLVVEVHLFLGGVFIQAMYQLEQSPLSASLNLLAGWLIALLITVPIVLYLRQPQRERNKKKAA